MGERDLDRYLAAGAASPVDPDAGEPGSAVPDARLCGATDRPVDPAGSVGCPPPVVGSDLVEAVADFVRDLVDVGDIAGCGPAAGDCTHDGAGRDTGDEAGSCGAG